MFGDSIFQIVCLNFDRLRPKMSNIDQTFKLQFEVCNLEISTRLKSNDNTVNYLIQFLDFYYWIISFKETMKQ